MPLTHLLVGTSRDPFQHGKVVEIEPEARRRGLAAFGASGAGKSALFRNMISLDIANGQGLTLIDPHGELAEQIIERHIPRFRTNDVIYIRLSDRDRVIGLNPLACPRPDQRGLVVSNLVGVFKVIWEDAFKAGARMEDIFRNALHALIEQPKPVSIIALPKLLTDTEYRTAALAHVTNPSVLDFFHNTYDRWDSRFREEAISSVLNKVRAFTTDPLIRAVIGQARSSFDFRKAMDERKIIICDLAKGAIGADAAMLIGSLIILEEKMAALSRSDIPEDDRVFHFLYAEESQNFVADFESILSETRKFRYVPAISTQLIENLSRETVASIFANAGNLITFRVSNRDAERLKDEFAMTFPGAAIQDLPDYHVYVRRLTCDEKGCRPVEPEQVATYAPLEKTPGAEWRSKIERTSNERYTKPRATVDAAIARFMLSRPTG